MMTFARLYTVPAHFFYLQRRRVYTLSPTEALKAFHFLPDVPFCLRAGPCLFQTGCSFYVQPGQRAACRFLLPFKTGRR